MLTSIGGLRGVSGFVLVPLNTALLECAVKGVNIRILDAPCIDEDLLDQLVYGDQLLVLVIAHLRDGDQDRSVRFLIVADGVVPLQRVWGTMNDDGLHRP